MFRALRADESAALRELRDVGSSLEEAARLVAGLPERTREELILASGPEGESRMRILVDVLRARASADALAPALVKLDSSATPSAARAAQATENVWRAIDEEFTLLSSTQVAAALGAKSGNRSYASDQRAARRILGVRRLNSYLYPGFQFDRATGTVKPAVPALLRAAERAGRSDEGLALWLVGPTTYLGGDRPVDHLDEVDRVVKVAEDAWGVEW